MESTPLERFKSFDIEIRSVYRKRIFKSLNLISKYSSDNNLLMKDFVWKLPKDLNQAREYLLSWDELKILMSSPWLVGQTLAEEVLDKVLSSRVDCPALPRIYGKF